jgi:hypothetical protein
MEAARPTDTSVYMYEYQSTQRRIQETGNLCIIVVRASNLKRYQTVQYKLSGSHLCPCGDEP